MNRTAFIGESSQGIFVCIFHSLTRLAARCHRCRHRLQPIAMSKGMERLSACIARARTTLRRSCSPIPRTMSRRLCLSSPRHPQCLCPHHCCSWDLWLSFFSHCNLIIGLENAFDHALAHPLVFPFLCLVASPRKVTLLSGKSKILCSEILSPFCFQLVRLWGATMV